jgi:hypothetical protein
MAGPTPRRHAQIIPVWTATFAKADDVAAAHNDSSLFVVSREGVGFSAAVHGPCYPAALVERVTTLAVSIGIWADGRSRI